MSVNVPLVEEDTAKSPDADVAPPNPLTEREPKQKRERKRTHGEADRPVQGAPAYTTYERDKMPAIDGAALLSVGACNERK